MEAVDRIPTPVPTWVIQAKYELAYQPAGLLRNKYPNLVGATVIEDGGHFLAFEMPKVLADDVYAAVAAFRDWHKNAAKETKNEL
ncbi:Juvenile hormone epoxide hydrolase [Eumeta japonica]|uniref:Juvenile hormone epoxide hydrolase n=1 Tax=Eumeta variegata TaxID=151549 RepID=A0A4C1V1Y8_EUMVA|nr:Juvenile hormone epoxide hydrolase [Eumeta japonica]